MIEQYRKKQRYADAAHLPAEHVIPSQPTTSYMVGQYVTVARNKAPNINREGGSGRVVRAEVDNTNGVELYDVDYTLGGSEKNLTKVHETVQSLPSLNQA